MSKERDYSSHKLGALIDETVDEKTVSWIQSLANETLIRKAAVLGPRQNTGLKNFANRLLTGEVDMVIFLTAAGVSQFFERANSVKPERLIDALCDIVTIAIGNHATRRLADYKVQPTHSYADTSDWREVLIRLESEFQLANLSIGLEKTKAIHGLAAGLEARGAEVTRIDVIDFDSANPSSAEQDILDAIEDGDLGTMLFPNSICAARFAYLIERRDQPILQKNSHRLVILSLDQQTEELLADRGMTSDIVLRRENYD